MHAPTESSWPVLDDLLTRVTAARRRVASAQASEAALLAEAIDIIAERTDLLRQEASARGRGYVSEGDLPLREVSLELGMAMRVSDRTVQGRLSDAYALTTRFPRTHRAWSEGDIDAAHAWAIVRAGTALTDPDDRGRFEALALDAAATESPSRMAQAARAIAAAVRPDVFAERSRTAMEERSVRLYDLDEGMARIVADLPAPLAYAILDSLTGLARAEVDPSRVPMTRPDDSTVTYHSGDTRIVTRHSTDTDTDRGADDRRTLDQRRADLLCDLVLTGTPTATGLGGALAGITARIQVTVPALTLAGDPDSPPALLAGYGPVDGDLARRLAGLAPGWDRVFTDPRTGAPLDVDRYRPSAHLSRLLAARDERCRTPGCGQLVHRCDRDHTVAAAVGGPTAIDNLAHFCRRHHI